MLRIMVYNIYRGGHERLQEITEIVRQTQPDILGILEANRWGAEEQRIVRAFSKDIGLPHYFFAKSNTEYDLALFSKEQPIAIAAHREHVHHSAIFAEFSFSDTNQLLVTLVHLNPFTEDARVTEIQKIIEALAARGSKNTVLMGDFNMLSPHDPYDHHQLLTTLQAQGIKKFGETALRFDAFRTLESAGYHDAMALTTQSFTPTVPTPANADYAHAAPLRLDYIFVSPALASSLTNAHVITAPPADRASDHYPLVANFTSTHRLIA